MKSILTHIAFLVISTALIAFMTAGCRTMHGFGQDVSTAGSHIEDAAH